MVVFIKCLNCLLATLGTYGLGSITQGFFGPLWVPGARS